MKASIIVSLFAAACSTMAMSCEVGETYCGKTLFRRGEQLQHSRCLLKEYKYTNDTKGKYRDHLKDVLEREGKETDLHHYYDSLFYCTEDGKSVTWKATCAPYKCQAGSDGNSAECDGEPE
jgi:hypothetical protein